MAYWSRFLHALSKDSVPWARDNILVAGAMAVIPAFLIYLLDQKHSIDWELVRTALWLYLIMFLAYAAYHVTRTAKKLDSDLVSEINRLRHVLAKTVAVSGLLPDDPRIEAKFLDERASGDRCGSLSLINRGSEAAEMIRVLPIKLIARTLIFPHVEAYLPTLAAARFTPQVGDQWGYDSHHDFVRALSEEWTKRGNSDIREISIPVRVDYEDNSGNRFEANFEIVYHAGFAYYNPTNQMIAECQNITYRRFPMGVTSP